MKKTIRRSVQRRKVAFIAAKSRQFTVKNCCIPAPINDVIDKESYGSWKNPKEGYPQPESMHKKGSKLVYNKDTKRTERVWFESTFPDAHHFEKHLWKNLGRAAKNERYVQSKLEKWDRLHPKPCEDNDLFKEEYLPKWEMERQLAIERIRDFVVSVYDKLPLNGRFKTGKEVFQERKIADIKDIGGDGHNINSVDPEKSKLMKKAQRITDDVYEKDDKLVCSHIKDHKRKKGRLILPKKKAA